MLSVTERAAEVLMRTLEYGELREGQGLRLARNAAGEYGLAIDERRDEDEAVPSGEREVLLVEGDLWEGLKGAVLDVIEAPEGARLTLRLSGGEAAVREEPRVVSEMSMIVETQPGDEEAAPAV